MNWYFQLVARRPFAIIIIVGTLSIISLLISTTRKLPNFSDPQLGFKTRGTHISKRLITWDNLKEATRPSGILTVNPNDVYLMNRFGGNSTTNVFSINKISGSLVLQNTSETFVVSEKVLKLNFNHKKKIDINNVATTEKIRDYNSDYELDYHSHNHDHDHLSSDGFFCEGLSNSYSHMVFEAENSSESLLSLDALHSICVIQKKLMDHEIMGSICQTVRKGNCCSPWSLPNYVAMLFNHTDCLNINEGNVAEVKKLLYDCAKYFIKFQLDSDCHESGLCHGVPVKCSKFNSVYNILYYLSDINLSANYTGINKEKSLSNSMIFLPIARSSAVLPYYYNLTSSILVHKNVHISAMDLGLKNVLFNDCLIKDAFLMIAGGSFMIVCIWCYTNSLVITVATVLAILISLIISYFIYTFIFKIKFFPFMNLLGIVVAIGIGADDTFIFYKTWQCFKAEKVNYSMKKLVSETLKHSSVSMFVTSLTTAAAFYSGCFSSVTAINCFSVFAGTAVLVNFFLMITWLPASCVISQKSFFPPIFLQWRPILNNRIRTFTDFTVQVKALMDKLLILSIVRFKWLWLFLFSTLAIASALVVFYYPKLRLPDSRNFRLFQSSNLFEQYDIKYKDKFWFERLRKVDDWDNANFKLPLRFVWGVLPVDNGNYFEPTSKGTLEFDSTFDMASPESQDWLLNFCRLLRLQRFYEPTQGPLLPNCFIESFKNWMQRRCIDAIDNSDRTPCCESSKFPYSRKVFKYCVGQVIGSLYQTPADYFNPGVAGPKFSKINREEIKAVVVEYNSNHSYSMSFNDMHDFYTEVSNWFEKQINTAPQGMRNGWFITDLDFYDLQLALSDGTAVAIGISMASSLAVLFVVTLNVLISLYTILTISFVIFVTVAFLVLIGWSLNVLESVAVTTAIGLAVDFSIHYGINYGLLVENSRESAVGFTLARMGGPTLMAALTTSAAGFFMLPSSVLAYIQIGIFLLIVMGTSWFYSTIFLMSLLSVIGPQRGFGQFSYKSVFFLCDRKSICCSTQSNKTSSITEGHLAHENLDENYEMEALNSSTKETFCIN